MIDLIEIYVHWYAGRSQAQIADSLGLDRKTVRKYLAPVTAAGLVPGGPPVMTEADWRARAQSWFPAVVDKGLRQVTWPAIGVHRDYISAQLAAGVTVSTIHQRLVDEHGLVASVASLRRWVGGNLPEEARRAQVRVLRPGPVEPGSEAQIDYGRLGVWTDPATGRRHTVQAFVMVLACSRYMFVRPVLRMDQEAWTRCHVEAFAFFAGVPARNRSGFELGWGGKRYRGVGPRGRPCCLLAGNCGWLIVFLTKEKEVLGCVFASRPRSIGSGARGWPRRSRVTWFGWSRIATASRASGVASQSCSSSASSLVHEGPVRSVSCRRKSKRSWPSGSTATTRTRSTRPMAKEVRGPVEQMLSVVLAGFEPSGRPHHALPFAEVKLWLL